MNSKYFHIALGILSLISVFFILQIVFGCFSLIDIEKPAEEVERINEFVVDLSLGILTSIFFYYLLVFIPAYNEKLRIRKINQENIDGIAMYMEIIMAYYAAVYNIPYNDKKLFDIDIDNIPNIPNPNANQINFNITLTGYKRCYNGSTEIGLIHFLLGEIKSCSEEIMKNPMIVKDDSDLIELISKIKENDFYRIMLTLYSLHVLGQGAITDQVKGLYRMYLDISRYAGIREVISVNELVDASMVAFVYN